MVLDIVLNKNLERKKYLWKVLDNFKVVSIDCNSCKLHAFKSHKK